MFENAQPEQNSGSGKIVGGVIVVAAIIIGVVYFAYFHDQPSTGAATGGGSAATTTAASGEKPDPMRDLKIVRSNLRQDQTQTMAMWDIVVGNRSRDFGYKNIKYATNYYNAQDAVIYSNEGTLPEAVEPNDQHTFSSVNDGLYPVGTARYTIELKGAEPAE
jgi:hypothetical protein